MPLQDLTPQLRTRLSRMERVVGVFVTLATILLLSGFFYYILHTARRKGWFLTKVPYYTFVRNAAGLKVGDPIKLMGFDVGEITRIEAMPPGEYYNVYLEMRIKSPYHGYLWTDSRAKITAADFLGHRYIEVTKGGSSQQTNVMATYQEKEVARRIKWLGKVRVITGIWDPKAGVYKPFTSDFKKGYPLDPEESPALTERLEVVVNGVEAALPRILSMTNQLVGILSNSAQLTARFNGLLGEATPLVTNLGRLTAQLGPPGSLGELLIPTNLNTTLTQTLRSSDSLVSSVNTNLSQVFSNVNRSLENLASMTGNLREQVQGNSLILTEISTLVANVDDLVQGLKRHWLLRSSFGKEPPPATESVVRPRLGPDQK